MSVLSLRNRCDAAEAAGAGRHFARVLDQAEQAVAGVVVVQAVDEGALARAGHAREHARRVVLDRPVGGLTRQRGQRQQILFGPAVRVAH